MAKRKRTPAQAQARRRELDRIRKQARRMKAKGFEVPLEDLANKTLSELKKISTERLARLAKATMTKYAGVMTYADYKSMSKKEREEFLDTGYPPKDLQRKLERRLRRKEKREREELGTALLANLEEAISEGKGNGKPNLSKEVDKILKDFISLHSRKEAGARLVLLEQEEFQYIPLCDYVLYVQRGEEMAAAETLAAFVKVLEDRDPTSSELEEWEQIQDGGGWIIDPETGEPIT